MFIRTKTIKGSRLVQLVESYRNAEGLPRQRVIASLGDVSLPEGAERMIARAVENRLRGEQTLFEEELSREASEWVARIVQVASRSKATASRDPSPVLDGVLVDRVESEEVVSFGPQMVALHAWDQLGLSQVLLAQGMNPQAVATAQLMTFNRLIEPLSEWALIDWAQRTALPEMLGVRITRTTKDRLYRTSDQLLRCRQDIETALRSREKQLFGLSRSIILYDVTNTHFEGMCEANPKARRGKNKQKRNDCPQVCVGMAFDEHGFALAHEVFEGNMADIKTLGQMLDRLTLPDEPGRPVVILDAAFASKDNLELIESRGYSFLVNMTRSRRTHYAALFENDTLEPIAGRKAEQEVQVKCVCDPDNESHRLVLCRSLPRREKEVAMLSIAERRFLADAQALRTRIENGKLKQPKLIERAIGSLKKKHPRVARFYALEYRDQTIETTRNDARIDQALDLCGDYVLKTDKTLDAPALWHLYMTLLQAETGFRMLKSSLGLRPNFHQIEERVDGHILISVIAYHLLRWISHTLEQGGDRREWRTIRRLLGTHSLVTTRLTLTDARVIRIRKPSLPDAAQQEVYHRLGIDWRRAFEPVKTEVKG